MHDCKLIWATPRAEELISYLARVSAPENQDNMETAPRLIRYLIKHKHWSPFEMTGMCLEINTTRGISAQVLRHRSFSFQEFSMRYADISKIVDEIPLFDIRKQDKKNRQNSTDNFDPFLKQEFEMKTRSLFSSSQKIYDEMLGCGVAKECARAVLPLATPTRLYMYGTIRSWIHYIDLRSANGTQEEHRRIALSAKDIFTKELPDVAEACWGGKDSGLPIDKDAIILELKQEVKTLKAMYRETQWGLRTLLR